MLQVHLWPSCRPVIGIRFTETAYIPDLFPVRVIGSCTVRRCPASLNGTCQSWIPNRGRHKSGKGCEWIMTNSTNSKRIIVGPYNITIRLSKTLSQSHPILRLCYRCPAQTFTRNVYLQDGLIPGSYRRL